MGNERIPVIGRSRRRRAATLVAALATVMALAAAGQAQATQHPAAGRTPAAVRPAVSGVISTVAGGVGGPGTATKVPLNASSQVPCGVTFSGSLYIADGVVRKVDSRTDWLTTPAGTFASAPPGDGGPAASAALDTCATTVDHHGNLVVSDHLNNVVRVVASTTGTFYGQPMTAGDIYTVAGGGTLAPNGVPASQAALADPEGITVDHHGNLVFVNQGLASRYGAELLVLAETSGFFYNTPMTAGHIYTVSGSRSGAGAGFSGNGGTARKATLGVIVGGVQTDAAGNIVLAAASASRILVIAARSGTFYGQAMTVSHLYTVAGTAAIGFSGDGGPATGAELWLPSGVAADSSGNLVIADTSNGRVRVVAEKTGTFYGHAMTAGDIYTLVSGLVYPVSVAVDSSANVVIDVQGIARVLVLAASTGSFYGQAMTAGQLYTVAGNAIPAATPCCSGDLATRALLVSPAAVATDHAGNMLVSDGNQVQVVAASTGTFYGKTRIAGHVYTVITPQQDGSESPAAVAVDAAGNLVLADQQGNKILVYAATSGEFYGQSMAAGNVYPVAGTGAAGRTGNGGPATSAELYRPAGVTTDSAGNLVIADTTNNEIRVVAVTTGTFYGKAMTAGNIYLVAGGHPAGFSGDGGPATAAALNVPISVQVDGAGNLVIADEGNTRIRVVAKSTGTFYGQAMTAGDIYTVAGGGSDRTSSGIPATSAIVTPGALAIDGAGNLAFTDPYADWVRVVAVKTGSFYGQAMTAGDVYTVAGTGAIGFSGDGGPATAAEFHRPGNLAMNSAGDLLVTDLFNNRVRLVGG